MDYVDIRLVEAERIAAEFGFDLYPGRCDCGWPLMEDKQQKMPFCFSCFRDRQQAQIFRTALLELKLGIVTITHSGPETFITTFEPTTIITPPAPKIESRDIDWGPFLKERGL